MKFKGKDGNVYTSAELMRVSYCRGNCNVCNIPNESGSCSRWVHFNPAEAARLMGYEVVEDEPHICATCCGCEIEDPGIEDCLQWVKRPEKETDMDKQKPRICQVLGVEVGEQFEFDGSNYVFRINPYTKNPTHCYLHNANAQEDFPCVQTLCRMINSPKSIMSQPRTEEKEDAVDGMCCDCVYGGPCCDWSENEDCPNIKSDGSCWRPYTEKETPMQQDKPLSEWTLGEVKEYCQSRCSEWRGKHETLSGICKGCSFFKVCSRDADRWDLTGPPRFTEEEVADAAVLERIISGHKKRFYRDQDSFIILTGRDGFICHINDSSFPSIRPGQSVRLS